MMIRAGFSLLGGAIIAVLIFWFMVGLIANRQQPLQPDAVSAIVELQQPPPAPDPPPPTPQEQPAPDAAPALEAMPVSALPAIDTPALDMPALDLAPMAMDIAVPASRWSGQLGKADAALTDPGQAFREITPLGARRPNIPALAWKNKIDGWVLVAFTLGSDGHPRNVRVVDSQPRGVFDQQVKKAVADWVYDARDIKGKTEVVVTQKVELFWKDFPENDPLRD